MPGALESWGRSKESLLLQHSHLIAWSAIFHCSAQSQPASCQSCFNYKRRKKKRSKKGSEEEKDAGRGREAGEEMRSREKEPEEIWDYAV